MEEEIEEVGDHERLLRAGFSEEEADQLLDNGLAVPVLEEWRGLFPEDGAEAICRASGLTCFNEAHYPGKLLGWRKAGLSLEQAEEWDEDDARIVIYWDDPSPLRDFWHPQLLAALVGEYDEEVELEEAIDCARSLLSVRPHMSQEELIDWISKLQDRTRWNHLCCVSKWLTSSLSEELCLKGIELMQGEDGEDDALVIQFIESLNVSYGEQEVFNRLEVLWDLVSVMWDRNNATIYTMDYVEWFEQHLSGEQFETFKESGVPVVLLFDFIGEFPDEPLECCLEFLAACQQSGAEAIEWRRAGFRDGEEASQWAAHDHLSATEAFEVKEAGVPVHLVQACALAHDEAAYQSGYWFSGQERAQALISFYRVLGPDRMVDGMTTAIRLSMSPSQALEWFEEMSLDLMQGFLIFDCPEPGLASDWLARGFTPAMAARAIQGHGWMHPSYLESLLGEQIEPPQFDYSEDWQVEGFTYEQAAAWWASGFSAPDAALFRQQGAGLEEAVHLQLFPPGFDPRSELPPSLLSRQR